MRFAVPAALVAGAAHAGLARRRRLFLLLAQACQPDGSTTLAETPDARVYQVERQRNGHSTLYTYGCLKAFGSQVLLASDAEPSALFPRAGDLADRARTSATRSTPTRTPRGRAGG